MTEAVPKRSVIVAGHRTSLSLEDPFWLALQELSIRENLSMNKLVEAIDARKGGHNLSSACRLEILADLEKRLAAALVQKSLNAGKQAA